MTTDIRPFASNRGLAQWVVYMFVGTIIVRLIAMASSYMQIMLVQSALLGQAISPEVVAANDARQQFVGTLQIAMVVPTAILFTIWVYRAHANLPSLMAGQTQFTPGFAAGCFYIPVVSLWMPFQAVRELWKASDPTATLDSWSNWHEARSSPLIGLWWFGFIGLGVMSQFFSSVRQTSTLEGLVSLDWISILLFGLGVADAILAILIVTRINERQTEKHQRITLSFGTGSGEYPIS